MPLQPQPPSNRSSYFGGNGNGYHQVNNSISSQGQFGMDMFANPGMGHYGSRVGSYSGYSGMLPPSPGSVVGAGSLPGDEVIAQDIRTSELH